MIVATGETRGTNAKPVKQMRNPWNKYETRKTNAKPVGNGRNPWNMIVEGDNETLTFIFVF